MINSNEKLNIAIAGYGFGKKVHLPALSESNSLKPISFFHPDKEKNYLIEKETGLKCFSNWNNLINNQEIDGIIIATPPEFRFQLAKDALINQKHVLLEKPVALNSNEIKELQRISLINRLSVCVDFEYRAVPLFLQTKKIIEGNLLGQIYLVKLDWLMGSRSDPNREWNWYSLSEKGGGVIGALGTHAFDILNWFFGETTKVSGNIFTSISKRPNKSKEILEVTSEDICLANLDMKNYFNERIPCQISLSSVSKSGRGFSLEIYGSDGSLFLKSENQKDYVHGFNLNIINKSNKIKNIKAMDEFLFEKTWTDGRIAPVKRIHDLWSKSIKDSTPIIPGLNEGLQSQIICEAIKKSSDSGITVNTDTGN